MGLAQVPRIIEENVIDLDGTIVESWRLMNDPKRIDELQTVPGVELFLGPNPHPQLNTLLSHAKLSVAYQLYKLERFRLLTPFEQHNGGGGVFICERSEEKREHLENLLARFLARQAYQDPHGLAVIGNNPESELKYGIELGLTVIRIRQKEDPYSCIELTGEHFEVQDWYEVMKLPFYRAQFGSA